MMALIERFHSCTDHRGQDSKYLTSDDSLITGNYCSQQMTRSVYANYLGLQTASELTGDVCDENQAIIL